MAARRGKSQARRNQGQGGLPGWAWMVLGIVLTVAVVLLAPKWLKSDGDGLWRPQPNPDARPAPVADGPDEATATADSGARRAAKPAAEADAEGPEYDFYTLLPGKELPLSDAELAATERAEAERIESQREAARDAAADAADPALPAPVDGAPAAVKPAVATVAVAPADGARYLLQAGAFQASGQAEELKARIALLGLGARVESAQIDGKTIFRVRMGPYGTASDLADAKRKLASGGLPAMAIKVR